MGLFRICHGEHVARQATQQAHQRGMDLAVLWFWVRGIVVFIVSGSVRVCVLSRVCVQTMVKAGETIHAGAPCESCESLDQRGSRSKCSQAVGKFRVFVAHQSGEGIQPSFGLCSRGRGRGRARGRGRGRGRGRD